MASLRYVVREALINQLRTSILHSLYPAPLCLQVLMGMLDMHDCNEAGEQCADHRCEQTWHNSTSSFVSCAMSRNHVATKG